jgi:methylamine--corrinoid protein Co-methyltransferase
MYANERLQEIFRRSRAGKYMSETEYDLNLARRAQELVDEFELTYDPEVVCPSDDGMADRVFEAGLQLLADVGAYHLDTERVIRFSRAEILDALRAAPEVLYLGEGKDMVVAVHRGVEDPNPPLNLTGPAGQACLEENYLQMLISYAQEPYVQAIESGATLTYNGQDIVAGTLLEVKAVQRDSATAREAVRRVGKPGMHIGDCATGMTAIGKMAASDPRNGLRPCDGRLVAQMCELKVDDDQLARIPHLRNYGSHIINLMTPLTGGIGGGPRGVAVVSVAETLLGVVAYYATYHYLSITHIKWTNNSDPWGMYVLAMAGQALARNTRLVITDDPFTVSGPCTDELLYEVAGHAIIGSVCGYTQHGVGSTGGNLPDHHTGLEAGFQGEVGLAATKSGLTRARANEIALKLLPKYQDTFDTPKRGVPFAQAYDLKAISPTQEWQDCYRRVKEELTSLGLEFEAGPWD